MLKKIQQLSLLTIFALLLELARLPTGAQGAILGAHPSLQARPVQLQAATLTRISQTSPCQDVAFVGAEGSGETAAENGGLGPEVQSALTFYADALPGYRIGWYPLPYPSAPAGIEQFLSPRYLRVFFASIDSGVAETETFLKTRAARCPAERIVVSGYSQGAMVMHRVIFRLATNQTSPDSATQILPRLDGAIVMADGDRRGDQSGSHSGTAPSQWLGVLSYGVSFNFLGIAGNIYKPIKKKIPHTAEWPATRWHDICMDQDFVCDYSLTVGFSFDVHSFAYRPEGSGENVGIALLSMQSEAKKIAAQTRRSTPVPSLYMVTASLPPAVSGSPYEVQLLAAGGKRPYLWQASLPSGLTIESTSGIISGTVAKSVLTGDSTVIVVVSDSSNRVITQDFPLAVSGSTPVGPGEIVFDQIRATSYNSCARTSIGAAMCWGDNYLGRVGGPLGSRRHLNQDPTERHKSFNGRHQIGRLLMRYNRSIGHVMLGWGSSRTAQCHSLVGSGSAFRCRGYRRPAMRSDLGRRHPVLGEQLLWTTGRWNDYRTHGRRSRCRDCPRISSG